DREVHPPDPDRGGPRRDGPLRREGRDRPEACVSGAATAARGRGAVAPRRRVTGRALVLLAVVGALLVAAVYPLRAWIREQSQVSLLEHRLVQLQQANSRLDRQILHLH